MRFTAAVLSLLAVTALGSKAGIDCYEKCNANYYYCREKGLNNCAGILATCSSNCGRYPPAVSAQPEPTQYYFSPSLYDGIDLDVDFDKVEVGSIACWGCQKAAGFIEGVIAKRGCLLADAEITAICEGAFLGPEDPLADICAVGFIAACSTFAGWIARHTFTPQKACSFIHMC